VTNRLSTLTDALKRQLEQHGYHLTDDEARDVAATLVMADQDPVYRALVALMDLGADTQNVFWYERFENAEQSFRDFAADYADRVELDEAYLRQLNSLRIVHRESRVEIACLRLDDVCLETAVTKQPAPAPRVSTTAEAWSPAQEMGR
jgi:hypothetical protein